jgi:hypothetical protein
LRFGQLPHEKGFAEVSDRQVNVCAELTHGFEIVVSVALGPGNEKVDQASLSIVYRPNGPCLNPVLIVIIEESLFLVRHRQE